MNFQGRNLVLNAGCILLDLQSVLLGYKSLSLVNKTPSSWLIPPQKWGHSTILVQKFFSIRTRSLRDFLATEIPSQVLVKTLWILTNTSPNSYLFENVSVSFHIKKTATFQKQATTKRTAWVFFFLEGAPALSTYSLPTVWATRDAPKFFPTLHVNNPWDFFVNGLRVKWYSLWF